MTQQTERDALRKLADWPVLPRPYFGSGRYLGVAGSRGAYTTTQIQAYGVVCAAQARKLALSEAIVICRRNAQNTSADELEALRSEVK